MSERKTSEIKLRVTPSFKARVQAAAAKGDVSMSEWLEQAAEQRMAAGSLTGGRVIPFQDVVRLPVYPDSASFLASLDAGDDQPCAYARSVALGVQEATSRVEATESIDFVKDVRGEPSWKFQPRA